MYMQMITLCFESIKLKKELIEKYSGLNDKVSQIIAHDSRAAIAQTQEEIKYFTSKLE